MSKPQAIGIIDSGVGGLTVAREVIRQLPREQIIYFGDNARCPYGSRPADEIRMFTNQMVQFVLQYPVKALVIACNTAAAVVLEEVRSRTAVPVIGVIEPGARAAISASKTGRIGIIGTEMTVRAGAYERVLQRLKPDLYTMGMACPPFVTLVESGRYHTPEARQIVEQVIAPLTHEELDTLILGCTHYPLLAPLIEQAIGSDVTLISSAEETARELSALLSLHQLYADQGQSRVRHQFYTSGDAHLFRQIGEEWMGFEIDVETKSLDTIYQVK
ncbi:glutamate racemase [Brevibacillus humidisoli]|uniref:glutamate racemase n=1 Tax=Brevibacillus humidisoli TaxID=2895522 RepID=UPI001E317966|nr:glutamate racemase [Brevibacillus humidisoli]UFJ39096.1 glutamate racemase [Brevibacillus humidisoli]